MEERDFISIDSTSESERDSESVANAPDVSRSFNFKPKEVENTASFKLAQHSSHGQASEIPAKVISEQEVLEYLKHNRSFLSDYIIKNIDGATLNRWVSKRSDVYQGSIVRKCRTSRAKSIIPSAAIELKRPSTTAAKDKLGAIKSIANAVQLDADVLVIVKLFRECAVQSTKADAAFIFMANLDPAYPGWLFLLDAAKEDNMKGIKNRYIIKDRSIPASEAAFRNEIILTNEIEEYPTCNEYTPLGVHTILAAPLTEEDGTVVAVIEMYRFSGSDPFKPEDMDFAETYAQWARTTLTFSAMYHKSNQRERVNGFILQFAQTLFSKITEIDEVMLDIVSYAKALVHADRGALYLLTDSKKELEIRILDSPDGSKMLATPKESRKRFSVEQGIVGYVAQTGKTENCINVEDHPRFDKMVDSRPHYTAHSMICMAVKVKDEIIGVIQMINSREGKFLPDSEENFGIFAVYCGLALHIARMYNHNIKCRRQCKETMEVMSLHTQCTEAEVKALKKQPLPSHISKIASFAYSPWSVPHEQKIVHVIYMFRDLFAIDSAAEKNKTANWLRFDIDTVLRFVLTVRKNYRAVPYHNWDHAVAVNQAAYVILKKCCKGRFALEEEVSMFIGALCHDIDHRGRTNQYMIKNQSPLAALYSTSTMEQHHLNLTVTILQRDGHNIFQMISSHRYKVILDLIKTCILATDLLLFFNKNKDLKSKLDDGPLDFTSRDERMNLICNCMTACDLCAMYKPWNIQFTVVLIIMKEFWLEGDEEKKNGRTPIPMMDRNFRSDLPASQVGFISFICLPCFSTIARVFPEYRTVVAGVTDNLERWKELTELDEDVRLQKLGEMEIKIVDLRRHLVTTEKNKPRPSFHFASGMLSEKDRDKESIEDTPSSDFE